MRRGRQMAVFAALFAAACSSSAPLKDMVGYVPPTSLPAQPKKTLVADSQERVWAELVDFINSSAFELDHLDPAQKLLVARYSGNPEPYIDCGSIVTHQGGALGQIPGSASAVELNYEIDDDPVILNRLLNLDSRIIIRLGQQPQGTVIKTDTTYVVTKTVDVAERSGAVREGSRETISFEAGSRAEFSKGTACQPNGSLDLAVLQSLPNIVGSDEIDRAELGEDRRRADVSPQVQDTLVPNGEAKAENRADAGTSGQTEDEAVTVPAPAAEGTADDWVLPETGLPPAAWPASPTTSPVSEPEVAEANVAAPERSEAPESQAVTAPETDNDRSAPTSPNTGSRTDTAILIPDDLTEETTAPASQSPGTIVDDTTRKLLDSLNCDGEEWHFCDLVELTAPYRKRNIEALFGLTVNTTDSFTSQVVGRDMKLDVLFPSFASHLHIAYARRDGTVDHVMSTSEVWPADLAHQIADTGKTIPGPAGLAMIIAIASDEPLFTTAPDGVEDAEMYLGRLKQRLAELEAEHPDGPVAASQLLIYVENAET